MIKDLYTESVKESGDYLRMALQYISDFQLAYTPVTYLLWYEYARGRNEQFIRELNQAIDNKQVTEDEMVRLFRKYFADRAYLLAEKKTLEFQKILSEITRHLGQSGDQIDRQGHALEKWAVELTHETSPEKISSIADRIVSETKALAASNKTLADRFHSTTSEIQKLRQELEGVKQIAKTDTLTRLLNRRGFDEAWEKLSKQTGFNEAQLSIIMLDIDHFKKVNDTFGHLIGDNVLKLLGKLIKDQVKGKDVAARFGGEEFIVMLPETGIENAYILAEQIRNSLMKMNWKAKKTGQSIGKITVSLGIALYRNGETVDECIKRADDALYQAKKTGRNKTVTELDLI
jgi:diguanylate cyclase